MHGRKKIEVPLIRVPAKRGLSTRVELRNPDPSCNPYLALAASLTAGLDGINNKTNPPEPVNKNIYEMCCEERQENGIDALPKCLYEAIMNLSNNDLIKDALGSHVTEKYISAKIKEWEEYTAKVHQWEINQYLRAY